MSDPETMYPETDQITDALDAMQARCDAATPAPWERLRLHGLDGIARVLLPHWVRVPRTDPESGELVGVRHTPVCEFVGQDEDLEFIAHARTDLPRLLDALKGVLELHQRTSRWSAPGCEETGFDSVDDAIEYAGAPGLTAADLIRFDVCRECSKVEENGYANADDVESFPGYDMGLWPCATMRSITRALGMES